MSGRFEKAARVVYRGWKNLSADTSGGHPDEEEMACYLEGKSDASQSDKIREHVLKCDRCAEYLGVHLKIEPHLSKEVPADLLEKARKMVAACIRDNVLEIFVRLKEGAWEIIQTGGDVLVGQELVPAPVLRSRQINAFKEEISILKDLREARILVKLESKKKKNFSLMVDIKDKRGKRISRNLRVSLLKGEVEMESYVSENGSSIFEDVLPGDYKVEASKHERLVAIIDLKVKT
ncbi:MAG: hypothetical protein PHW98_07040 [Candidatus Omnitrophica bacterium]|nr:hypothetical protein [Candidatus Omnitrophota bacterium]MDD5771571.1 hypothetical protein [Candidatus Omnitrophota bacterium]